MQLRSTPLSNKAILLSTKLELTTNLIIMWELWGLTLVIILIPASSIPLGDEGVDWFEELLSSSSLSEVAISYSLRDISASLRNCFAKASISILLCLDLTSHTSSLTELTCARRSVIEFYIQLP